MSVNEIRESLPKMPLTTEECAYLRARIASHVLEKTEDPIAYYKALMYPDLVVARTMVEAALPPDMRQEVVADFDQAGVTVKITVDDTLAAVIRATTEKLLADRANVASAMASVTTES